MEHEIYADDAVCDYRIGISTSSPRSLRGAGRRRVCFAMRSPYEKGPSESGTRPAGVQDGSKMAGRSILAAEAGPKIEVPVKPVRRCAVLSRFRKECQMARKVADVMWELLAKAGVKHCYGIVGDALNPVIDAMRRNDR
jgi:hypothetical protein